MKTKGQIFLAALIGAFLVFRPPTAAAETTKVKIAYLPVVQALPLFVAIERSYFKEAGLEVEPIKFEVPNQIIDALLAGNVDFAISAATGITAVSQFKNPGTLKIFALSGSLAPKHLDHTFLIKRDSTISSIKDLRGKKLATLPGIQWRTIATHILKSNGLDVDKDVQLVQIAMPLHLQTLASGQVDALLTLEPIATIGRLQKITKTLFAGPGTKYIANPFYAGCGDVSTQFSEKNPKTTALVIAAFKKAIHDTNKNSNQTRPVLKEFTPLNGELIQKVPYPVFKIYSDFKTSDIQAVQKFADIFTRYGVIDGRVDARKLIYTP